VRGARDDRRLFVISLEVCLFVGQGVDVGVAAGRILSCFHGYLPSPEDHRSPACRLPATSMVTGPDTCETSHM
jgi:hypothetical protein